jgi:hypothetical protein
VGALLVKVLDVFGEDMPQVRAEPCGIVPLGSVILIVVFQKR